MKPFIREKMLEELIRIPTNVTSNFIAICPIVATIGHSQQAIKEHAWQQQSTNTINGTNRLLLFGLDDTSDVPSTQSISSREQGLDSHLSLRQNENIFLSCSYLFFLNLYILQII